MKIVHWKKNVTFSFSTALFDRQETQFAVMCLFFDYTHTHIDYETLVGLRVVLENSVMKENSMNLCSLNELKFSKIQKTVITVNIK